MTSNMEYFSIETLFDKLNKTQQVEVLSSLYWKLTDYQKDRFLEETENA
jgi:hypothetical protein